MVKNKLAPPFREAEFDIMYSQGISRVGDVLDIAVNHSIIQKSGTWFSYGDIRLGQGRENVKRYLEENDKLFAELEVKVKEKLSLIRKKAEPEENPADQ